MNWKCTALLVLFAGMLLPALTQPDDLDYLAYAQTNQGDYPLPEDIEDLVGSIPKHLVKLRWGDYSGNKIRVGVLEVENTTKLATYNEEVEGEKALEASISEKMIPLNAINTMVTDTMVGCGRFYMVEREVMDQIQKEQALGRGGETTSQTRAKKGLMLGARYIFKAAITEYEPKYKGSGGGLGLRGIGVGARKDWSMVAMSFRLIDSQSTQITWSTQIQVMVAAKGLGAVGRKSGKAAGAAYSYNNSPIGNAVRVGINYGVYELVKAIGEQPLEGKVVGQRGKHIIVNLGRDEVSVGRKLRAFAQGEEFTDPDTGLSLGAEEEEVGLLEVVRVMDRFCYTEPDGFDGEDLVRGDRVQSDVLEPSLRFAATWEGPKPKFKNPWKKRQEKKKKQRNEELKRQQNEAKERKTLITDIGGNQ
ncbi:MAG: CsgG/HfaB family protein [Acidobacteriota bacterium]|nr:CsgG/HfaB family protein [Acidobacteriota bacterium]